MNWLGYKYAYIFWEMGQKSLTNYHLGYAVRIGEYFYLSKICLLLTAEVEIVFRVTMGHILPAVSGIFCLIQIISLSQRKKKIPNEYIDAYNSRKSVVKTARDSRADTREVRNEA